MLPQEILNEALDYLKGNFPKWLIPKVEYSRIVGDEVEIFEEEVEDWESFCFVTESGNYVCPASFVYSKNDEQDVVPVGSNIVFDSNTILHEAIKLAKEEYPEEFNKFNQN